MPVPPTPYPNPSAKLPEQPDLEQLKKQAKDLRRHHIAGDRAAHDKVKQS